MAVVRVWFDERRKTSDRGGEMNVDVANLGMRGLIYVPHVIVIQLLNLLKCHKARLTPSAERCHSGRFR